MKTLLSTLIAASAMLVGCGDNDDDDDLIIDDTPDDIPEDDDDTGDTPIERTATILGTSQYSYLSGVGRVRIDSPQAFTAEIELRSDIPGSVRGWHVHVGRCATGGAIVGPPESYRPLLIDPDGTDAVSVQIAFALDPNAAYHINVHPTAGELSVIACGDLL